MTEPYASVPIPGSRRDPYPGAVRVGDVDPSEPVAVTVVVRRSVSSGGVPGSPADADDVQAAHEAVVCRSDDLRTEGLRARHLRRDGER